jgi:hypothetical protein
MTAKSDSNFLSPGLQHLSSNQINMIDEALGSVGEFGEVRLVVEKGRLRFVVTQTSHDALKYKLGDFNNM